MINNSISFTSKDLFLKKQTVKKQTESPKIEEQKAAIEEIEDDDYDSLIRFIEEEDRKTTRNIVAGTVLGAALLATPFTLAEINKNNDPFYDIGYSYTLTNTDYLHPYKSLSDRRFEYEVNNITDKEILDNVDFSLLKCYQKDITLLRHLIASSRQNIKRNDPNAEEKKQEQIKDAQRMVDNIVKKYQMKASVSGNYDANNAVSKAELATLLDLQPLDGLPYEIKRGIILKALESYKPVSTEYATNQREVDKANERVDEKRQEAQKILDSWAIKAQQEFYSLLHPGEIRIAPLD